MTINGIIDLDNGELLEATGKHRISALDIQGSETAKFSFTFYQDGKAVTDNSVLSGAVIEFGVKADADYTGTSYKVYHNTFSASSDGLTYTATPTWATSEVESALGNSSSVKLHGQVKIVISGITYYSQVFEVEIHNDVIQAAGETSSVIFPRLITSTSDPTVNDDIGDGYGVSSTWLNTSSNAVHVLMDNTEGAAVWAGFLALTNGAIATDLLLADNVKAIFGTSSDGLEIYHDGANSYIADTGTGDLNISGSDDIFFRTAGGQNYANFNAGGSVDLFYANSKKFETTDTGATISGKLIVNGDLEVSTSGSITHFQSTTTQIDDPVLRLGENAANDNFDRGVEFLYNDGSAKVGFFGYDDSEDAFTFLTDATNNSEVFSGTLGNLKTKDITLSGGTLQLDSAYALQWGNNNNRIWGSSGNNYIVFETNGTEAARFDSAGHLLVNTTTSTADVFQSVANDVRYAGRFTGSEISGSSFGLRVRAGYTSADNVLLIEDRGGTDLFKITGDGSSHFYSPTTNTVATFESGDPGAGILLADDTGTSKIETSGAEFRVSCDDDDTVNDSVIKFRLDGATKATLDSTGLGIGGTPNELLQIDGTSPKIRLRDTDASGTPYAHFDASDGNILLSADAGNEIANSNIQFAIDGTEAARFDSSGHFLIPDDNKINIGTDEDINIYHSSSSGNSIIDNNSGDLAVQQKATDFDIVFKCRPSGTVTELLRLDGSASSINVPDNVVFKIGASGQSLRHNGSEAYINNTTGNWKFTQGASDKDFIWYTTPSSTGTATELMRLDGSAGSVGIGGVIPLSTLHIGTNDTTNGDLMIGGNNDPMGFACEFVSNNTTKLHIGRKHSADSEFIERVTILDEGNVGISEDSPASKCTVTGGDFETTTASKGVVLCSPNGTRYRLHINDDASVAVTAM